MIRPSARPADLLDLPALRSLKLSDAASVPADADGPATPGPLALLLALTTANCGKHRLFVAGNGGRVQDAVHIVCHQRARRWEVVRTTGVHGGGGWLEEALFVASIVAAGYGMPKGVARLAHDDPRLVRFEEAGFRPYSRETVFAVNIGRPMPPHDGFLVRPVQHRDGPTLQRLHSSTTPPTVGATDSLEARELLQPFFGGSGLVVEQHGEVLAAAGAVQGRRRDAASLRLVVRKESTTAGEQALEALLALLGRRGVKTAWLAVRDYLSDQLIAARLAGFSPVSTQAVLVKHTEALVRLPVFSRLREAPATLPAVHGSRLVHSGSHVRQCRLHGEARPRRRAVPVCAA